VKKDRIAEKTAYEKSLIKDKMPKCLMNERSITLENGGNSYEI
jgi:hypothetical protein